MTADAIQSLLDRIEIEKLAVLFGKGNDLSSSYFDLCLTDDVEVVYPFGQWAGLEEQKRRRDSSIGLTFKFTQTFLSNTIIEIDGDSATAQYQVFAAHSP